MDGECVETGAWTAIPPSAHTHSNPGNLPLSAEAHFTLPVTSPMLYFFARGSNQAGSVVIDDTCARGSDSVRVSVRAYYATEEALENAQVCKTRRSAGGDGVGVIVRFVHILSVCLSSGLMRSHGRLLTARRASIVCTSRSASGSRLRTVGG